MGGQVRPYLYADRDGSGHSHRSAVAPFGRWKLEFLVLQCTCSSGDRLPLRPCDFNPSFHCCGPRSFSAQRRIDQRWRLRRGARSHHRSCHGQDWHDHDGGTRSCGDLPAWRNNRARFDGTGLSARGTVVASTRTGDSGLGGTGRDANHCRRRNSNGAWSWS